MQVVENESVTGGAGVGTKGHRVLPHSTVGAIVRGGALCGVLDITAAFVVYGGLYGVNPVLILQGIAGGILGRSAFNGGYPVALLGCSCTFSSPLRQPSFMYSSVAGLACWFNTSTFLVPFMGWWSTSSWGTSWYRFPPTAKGELFLSRG